MLTPNQNNSIPAKTSNPPTKIRIIGYEFNKNNKIQPVIHNLQKYPFKKKDKLSQRKDKRKKPIKLSRSPEQLIYFDCFQFQIIRLDIRVYLLVIATLNENLSKLESNESINSC